MFFFPISILFLSLVLLSASTKKSESEPFIRQANKNNFEGQEPFFLGCASYAWKSLFYRVKDKIVVQFWLVILCASKLSPLLSNNSRI